MKLVTNMDPRTDKDRIHLDTEYSQPIKDPKILVVGMDDVSTEALIEAVKNAKDGQVVVVDSVHEPKFSREVLEEIEADEFIRDINQLRWMRWMGETRDYMPRLRRKVKHKSKCGLPSCGVMSERDYCCAEHCREHRGKKQ